MSLKDIIEQSEGRIVLIEVDVPPPPEEEEEES